MSEIENNRIYYDPYNEIVCDRFALEKLVKESEEKDKTIADLEAKLAESGKENKKAKNEVCKSNVGIVHLKNQLKQTKEKLAEKEEQIWALENQKLHAHNCLNKLKQQLAEKERLLRKYAATSCPIHQDKITFCIEKLEKVSQEFSMRVGITDNNMDLLNEIIDNQIAQLKEKK